MIAEVDGSMRKSLRGNVRYGLMTPEGELVYHTPSLTPIQGTTATQRGELICRGKRQNPSFMNCRLVRITFLD